MTISGIVVLLSIFALQQNGTTVQTGTITQSNKSNDCTFNVAAVAGNVYVENCPGIPPKALEGLNKELKARRLSEKKPEQKRNFGARNMKI